MAMAMAMVMAMPIATAVSMDMEDGGWRRSDLKRVQVQFFSIYHVSFNLTSISGNMFCSIVCSFFDFSQFLNSPSR